MIKGKRAYSHISLTVRTFALVLQSWPSFAVSREHVFSHSNTTRLLVLGLQLND